MDWCFVPVPAVIQALNWIIVVERELSQKSKLVIYQSVHTPTLTCGHELQAATNRNRLQVQVAEMSFLHWVVGLSLRERLRSSDIWWKLRFEPLLPLCRKEPGKVV